MNKLPGSLVFACFDQRPFEQEDLVQAGLGFPALGRCLLARRPKCPKMFHSYVSYTHSNIHVWARACCKDKHEKHGMQLFSWEGQNRDMSYTLFARSLEWNLSLDCPAELEGPKDPNLGQLFQFLEAHPDLPFVLEVQNKGGFQTCLKSFESDLELALSMKAWVLDLALAIIQTFRDSPERFRGFDLMARVIHRKVNKS